MWAILSFLSLSLSLRATLLSVKNLRKCMLYYPIYGILCLQLCANENGKVETHPFNVLSCLSEMNQ